jgi:hypothetical protein
VSNALLSSLRSLFLASVCLLRHFSNIFVSLEQYHCQDKHFYLTYTFLQNDIMQSGSWKHEEASCKRLANLECYFAKETNLCLVTPYVYSHGKE